jgi:type I restriction enzyme R subunit
MTIEPAEGDGKTITEIIDEIWANQDRDYNTRRLVKRLRRIDKEMSGEARELFARFLPDGDMGRFAEELPAKLRGSWTDTMRLLRDTDFRKLLIDYPRPRQRFIEATTASDTVSSGWLIKGGTGQEFKPDDYIAVFEQYVREHEAEIEAIQILMRRPQGWGPTALRALREALSQAPEHFTEPNLQRAYEASSKKALVDIISMVKRAAVRSSPLFSAEERVTAAVERITRNHVLTPEQTKWLDYIRQHLVANLSIDRDDFDLVPVLSDHGGWGRANRVFDGRLAELVGDLNKELVAA